MPAVVITFHLEFGGEDIQITAVVNAVLAHLSSAALLHADEKHLRCLA